MKQKIVGVGRILPPPVATLLWYAAVGLLVRSEGVTQSGTSRTPELALWVQHVRDLMQSDMGGAERRGPGLVVDEVSIGDADPQAAWAPRSGADGRNRIGRSRWRPSPATSWPKSNGLVAQAHHL